MNINGRRLLGVMLGLGLVIALGVLGVGCAELGARRAEERQTRVAERELERAVEAANDAAAIGRAAAVARAGGGARDVEAALANADGAVGPDGKPLPAVSPRGLGSVLGAVAAVGSGAVGADGKPAPATLADALERERAKAVATAAELAERLRAATETLEDRAADRAEARAQDDAAWGFGDLGVQLATFLGLPGAGLLGAYIGRARGILTGMTRGATQAAQVVGTARAVDPAIDRAFTESDKGALLRQALTQVHERVRLAIERNKSTPLPTAQAVVAQVVTAATKSLDDQVARERGERALDIDALSHRVEQLYGVIERQAALIGDLGRRLTRTQPDVVAAAGGPSAAAAQAGAPGV